MRLRILLLALVAPVALKSKAQYHAAFIIPEHKIHHSDTSGTFVKIINYFDRSVYKENLLLQIALPDSVFQYVELIPDSTGTCEIINPQPTYNLLINHTLQIPAIRFQENKLHLIDIRDEKGYLNLCLAKHEQKPTVRAQLIHLNKNDTTNITLPYNALAENGKYDLSLQTIPPKKYSLYSKTGNICMRVFHASVPVSFANNKKYSHYEISYSTFPDKKWISCQKGKLQTGTTTLPLQPKYLYRFTYGKSSRWRIRKKIFYINDTMKEFIVRLA